MAEWTAGDISGSQTLDRRDHLYFSHINELRTAIETKGYLIVGNEPSDDFVVDGVADNVEINAALVAANIIGKGYVQLRGIPFSIANSIVTLDDSCLVGVWGKTELNAVNGLNKHVVTNSTTSQSYSATPLNYNICVRDLIINGNKANQSGLGVHGLVMANVEGFVIERVSVNDCLQGNIVVAGARKGYVAGCFTDGAGIEGYYVTVGTHNVTFVGCSATNEQQGFECKEDCYDFKIISPNITNCNKGIQIRRGDSGTTTDPYGFSIIGGSITNSSRWPIYISDGVHDGSIVGATLHNYSLTASNSYDGILLTDTVANIKVTSVSFIDTQGSPTSRYGLVTGASTTGISASNNTASGLLNQLYNLQGGIAGGSPPMDIANSLAIPGLMITQTGNIPNANGTGAIGVDNTGGTGYGLQIYSARAGTQAVPLVRFRSTNSAFNQPVLRLDNQGADYALLLSLLGTGSGLDIDNAGTGPALKIRNSKTPASAVATGAQGEIAWDSSYIYVCVATNTWKRVAIATW